MWKLSQIYSLLLFLLDFFYFIVFKLFWKLHLKNFYMKISVKFSKKVAWKINFSFSIKFCLKRKYTFTNLNFTDITKIKWLSALPSVPLLRHRAPQAPLRVRDRHPTLRRPLPPCDLKGSPGLSIEFGEFFTWTDFCFLLRLFLNFCLLAIKLITKKRQSCLCSSVL